MRISWDWNRRHLSPVSTPKNINSNLAHITHFQHDKKNLVTNCVQSTVLLSCQPYLTHMLFSSPLLCSCSSVKPLTKISLLSWLWWGVLPCYTVLMLQYRKKKTQLRITLALCCFRIFLICFLFKRITLKQYSRCSIDLFFLHFAVLINLQPFLLSCFMLLWI